MSDCIFCKIINGDIPSSTVYETDTVKVFKDINPAAPVHLLVVPKVHIADINDIDETNISVVSECMFAIKKAAELSGVLDSGYRIISNCGKDSGQMVDHLHFHLLGGVNMGAKIL